MPNAILTELPPSLHKDKVWPWNSEVTWPKENAQGIQWPRISIVIPSYQQAKFLEESIRSVLLQGYPDLELIVIDGGSTDGSVEIIQKYEAWIHWWVSEEDKGQSDAINKGLRAATGVYFNWHNSDDVLTPRSLHDAARAFMKHPMASYVHGYRNIIDEASCVQSNTLNTYGLAEAPLPQLESCVVALKGGMQTGCLMNRELVMECGGVDEDLHYLMDRDLLLRLSLKRPAWYIPQPLVNLRVYPGVKSLALNATRAGERAVLARKFFALADITPELKSMKRETLSNAHRFAWDIHGQAHQPLPMIRHMISDVFYSPLKHWKKRKKQFNKHKGLKQIYLAGGNSWVFSWVKKSLERELKKNKRYRVDAITNPFRMKIKNSIIHFGARTLLLKNDIGLLHRSNRIVLNWYHGDLNDPTDNMKYLFWRLEQVQNRIHRIVVPCSMTREVLIQRNIPAEKIIQIPIGVDLELFWNTTPDQKSEAKNTLGLDPQTFCIGSFQKDGEGWDAGSVPKWVKGPEVLIDAARHVYEQHSNICVLLTGPARGFVQRGLEAHGIPYRHVYHEHYPDIAKTYAALDCYLIASRCEGGPKALMESWASGIPVVSTRVGMCADYVKDGVNGLLAPIEDARGLSEGVLRMMRDEQLRNRCIQQGLEDVKALAWSRVAKLHMEKLYAS